MNQQTLPWLLVGLALGYWLRGKEAQGFQAQVAPQLPLQPLQPTRTSANLR